jgi:protein-S-isoprenylcysteine O-methyltransferase Ste14
MWLVAVLAAAFVIAMAVRHDRELARDYGEAYARYRRRVPLLLPLRH